MGRTINRFIPSDVLRHCLLQGLALLLQISRPRLLSRELEESSSPDNRLHVAAALAQSL